MMNFPHMIPYNAPYYFVLLIAALLPMILTLAIKGTRWPWYQTLVTLVFLYISFGGEFWQQGVALIVYVIYQTLLTWGYAAYRKNKNAGWVFYLAVFLAILPLVWVKVSPFMTGKTTLLGFLGISYLTFKAVQVVMDLRATACRPPPPPAVSMMWRSTAATVRHGPPSTAATARAKAIVRAALAPAGR